MEFRGPHEAPSPARAPASAPRGARLGVAVGYASTPPDQTEAVGAPGGEWAEHARGVGSSGHYLGASALAGVGRGRTSHCRRTEGVGCLDV